ncbi:MAG: alpha/beta hydrolase [Cyanobacteria bacterium J06623_4]
MKNEPSLLWISVSPYLKCFDRRLLARLAKEAPVRLWEYAQTIDEPCCVESIIDALHSHVEERIAFECSLDGYSEQAPRRFHLLGHGTSGVIALLYARLYPHRVASLTMLSVGANPAVNWQSHYYATRQLLHCSRERVLAQMVRLLLGKQSPKFCQALVQLLAHDLDSNLTFHSLGHDISIQPGGTDMPLLVCNGELDSVVCAQQPALWQAQMKTGDHLWHCPDGRHFFHFHHAKPVAKVICKHIFQAEKKSVTDRTGSNTLGDHPLKLYRQAGLSCFLKHP